MSIEDRVKKIVSDQLGKSLDEIQNDSSDFTNLIFSKNRDLISGFS